MLSSFPFPQAVPQLSRQFRQVIAFGLAQICPLVLTEDTQQDDGDVIATKPADDPVAARLSRSRLPVSHLPAAARALHEVADRRMVGNLETSASRSSSSIPASLAAVRNAFVSITLCTSILYGSAVVRASGFPVP
jgi:hypothetical protein